MIHPVVVEDRDFSCDVGTPETSSHLVDEQFDFVTQDEPPASPEADAVPPDVAVEDSELGSYLS